MMSPRSLAPCSLAHLRASLIAVSLASAPELREEDPVGEGVVAEQLGELGLLRDVEEVGDVEQGRRLLAHRAHHLGVAVAERGHRDAAGEVEVLLAVGVPHPHPFAAHQGHRGALGGGHQVLVRPLDQRLRVGHVLGSPAPRTVARRRRDPAFKCVRLAFGCGSQDDLGADAFLGEDLEQDRVGDAAVDDVGLLGPAGERPQRGLDLREHAPVDDARA